MNDKVNPADPVPALNRIRARVASGELSLDQAAQALAQEGAPGLSEEDARILLAPGRPSRPTR